MKIAFDVMGFENELIEAIEAARIFSKKHRDVNIIFVGDKQKIESLLTPNDSFLIKHTTQVVKMDDTPITALRKLDTSMKQAILMVKNNEADGILSAGSTSCFVPLVYLVLGLIKGINKVAFMPFIPTINGVGFNLLDVGANINVDGNNLFQYAKMAKIYVEKVRKIQNPRIGILNVGTEKHKGFEYHSVAFKLLSDDKNMNFIGFVEPKNLLDGICDIVISDGFSGNICLKALEGSLKSLGSVLKKEYKKPWNWFAAISSLFVLKKVTKTFDYKNNAGAIVLGTNGVAIKTHGSADKQQFLSSLRILYETVNAKVIEGILDEFK